MQAGFFGSLILNAVIVIALVLHHTLGFVMMCLGKAILSVYR